MNGGKLQSGREFFNKLANRLFGSTNGFGAFDLMKNFYSRIKSLANFVNPLKNHKNIFRSYLGLQINL